MNTIVEGDKLRLAVALIVVILLSACSQPDSSGGEGSGVAVNSYPRWQAEYDIAFSYNAVSTTAVGAYAVAAADLDGDGDIDLASVSRDEDLVKWYENDGQQNFTAIRLARADGAISIHVSDVDQDGDYDLVTASYVDDTVAWFENDGAEEPDFTRRIVVSNADSVRSVFVADVDGDQDKDLLSASFQDDSIRWYENNGQASFTTQTVVELQQDSTDDTDSSGSSAADGAYAVHAADIDGDGDIDLMSASQNDDIVAWYENDGDENFTKHIIEQGSSVLSVYAQDIDSDGDTDIVAALDDDDTVVWYRNMSDVEGSDDFFLKRTVTTDVDRPASVSATDFDRDGDVDLISASSRDNTIAWYSNNGANYFTKIDIYNEAEFVLMVGVADIDGDGDADLMSASYSDNTIAWYENRSVYSVEVNAGETIVGTFAADDADVDTLSYTIAGGANAADFEIDETTAELSFLLGGATVAGETYYLTIAASDSEYTIYLELVVEVI
ncbi:FG-GAP-like repeat-containing protein [Reinekea thalattae]|uniref:FG-GAP-like repeat-containing protein n=1 Tax=Reinekea thalattae TaxID=2593301 RepID=UPI001650764C|nr:FG-GAP-like repeat-containing protein [Reinekea thalattae]